MGFSQQVILHESVIEQVLTAAQDGVPYETCGLIAKNTDNQCVAQWHVPSAIQSEVAFRMDAKAQVKAMVELESQGFEWAGIWHSHPQSDAYPSQTDIDQAKHWSDIFMMIVSLKEATPTFGCFRVIDGKVIQLDVVRYT